MALPKARTSRMAILGLFLRADRPVDLPLVVLSGLAEYGQEHDPAISSTPVRTTGCCVGLVLRSCGRIKVPKIRTAALQ
jgi:hypothetical protein